MKSVVVVAAVLLLGGCVGHGSWGKRDGWPGGNTLRAAARTAVSDPQTWVPLATAGLLIAANVDNQWSDDIAERQDVFDEHAEGVSNDFRDIASGAYLVTALLAPSPTVGAKLNGLAVGVGTAIIDGVVNQGLKDLTQRERPDGANDNSMPSGHASKIASRSTMAIRNLEHIDMPQWARHTARWSLHGLAIGNGYARVEAGKHHISDMLVGHAMGHFIATFMYEAFLEGSDSEATVEFQPAEGGGALTLTIPLH